MDLYLINNFIKSLKNENVSKDEDIINKFINSLKKNRKI